MGDEDRFYHQVRYLQRKTRCSNVVCDEFVKLYKKFSPTPVRSSIYGFDKKAKEGAGCDFIILHGCPQCNRHVYKPTDREETCPFIKENGTVCAHPRFNNKGKPLEVFVCVFYCFLLLHSTYVYIMLCRYVFIFRYGID